MKVAVMSRNNSCAGKSAFIIMLAALYARTQRKTSSIFSTGNLEDIEKMALVDTRARDSKTVGVYKALLDTASIENKEILDYGLRVGSEEVYLYNIYEAAMSKKEIEDLFIKTIRKIKTDLTLVEIAGDINDNFNHQVMKECDAIFCVFEAVPQHIQFIKDFKDNYDPSVVARTGYICQKYQADTMSGKRLLNLAGLQERSTIFIPYTPYVVQSTFAGNLNNIAKRICANESDVLSLRAKLLEAMQYLFDYGDKVHIIKDPTTWYK